MQPQLPLLLVTFHGRKTFQNVQKILQLLNIVDMNKEIQKQQLDRTLSYS